MCKWIDKETESKNLTDCLWKIASNLLWFIKYAGLCLMQLMHKDIRVFLSFVLGSMHFEFEFLFDDIGFLWIRSIM